MGESPSVPRSVQQALGLELLLQRLVSGRGRAPAPGCGPAVDLLYALCRQDREV